VVVEALAPTTEEGVLAVVAGLSRAGSSQRTRCPRQWLSLRATVARGVPLLARTTQQETLGAMARSRSSVTS